MEDAWKLAQFFAPDRMWIAHCANCRWQQDIVDAGNCPTCGTTLTLHYYVRVTTPQLRNQQSGVPVTVRGVEEPSSEAA